MTALGRLLQVIGWLWIAVGFLGPIVNIPDVSVFPGIIILFASRVIRKLGEQAGREERDAEQVEEQEPSRPLNTERSQPPVMERKTPEPELIPPERPRQRPVPAPEENATTVPSSATEPEERTDLSNRVLLTGGRTTDKPKRPVYPTKTASAPEQEAPLTSAEMIARARRRWDRKP